MDLVAWPGGGYLLYLIAGSPLVFDEPVLGRFTPKGWATSVTALLIVVCAYAHGGVHCGKCTSRHSGGIPGSEQAAHALAVS